MSKSRAFTLIELSIVLVIIGLLVGGVLVGRDLIEANKIRATISQKQSFDAATNAFKLKYNCLPGDCSTAANYGFGKYTTHHIWGVNGDGNGSISYFESGNYWQHLVDASLIPGPFSGNNDRDVYCIFPGYNTPASPITYQWMTAGNPSCNSTSTTSILMGGWELFDTQSIARIAEGRPGRVLSAIPFLGHSFRLSTAGDYWSGSKATYRPMDLYAIDTKVDDGNPSTGAIFAIDSQQRTQDQTSQTLVAPPVACVSGGVYVNTATMELCGLIWKSTF